jgi:hypothetical protein
MSRAYGVQQCTHPQGRVQHSQENNKKSTEQQNQQSTPHDALLHSISTTHYLSLSPNHRTNQTPQPERQEQEGSEGKTAEANATGARTSSNGSGRAAIRPTQAAGPGREGASRAARRTTAAIQSRDKELAVTAPRPGRGCDVANAITRAAMIQGQGDSQRERTTTRGGDGRREYRARGRGARPGAQARRSDGHRKQSPGTTAQEAADPGRPAAAMTAYKSSYKNCL